MRVSHYRKSARQVHLVLAFALLVMIVAMLYVLQLGNRMIRRHSPLINAAMEIQLELTTAHLWLEEIISGDRNEDIQSVWQHIDEADSHTQVMLEGGQIGDEMFVPPLDDPDLRRALQEVRAKTADLRHLTVQRWEAKGTSGVGTRIDQRYDAAFEDLSHRTELVVAQIQQIASTEADFFRWLQVLVIAGVSLLAAMMGMILYKYEMHRGRAEIEREELIAELGSKNVELEQFAYTVSHDLRSPLVTINGFMGLLKQDLQRGRMHDVDDNMDRVVNAANKMCALLDAVLDLSRIGRLVNPPEDVAMGELTREVLELLDGVIAERGVQVSITPDLPVLFGDHLRLHEVMQNLIENAVKFMGEEPNPRIEIGARNGDGRCVCYVRDNGMGIDPKYHEKIFGLFDTLDQGQSGHGVGLALTKRIIETHGGHIWIESTDDGKGTTFCFSLPSKDQSTRTVEVKRE